MITINQAAEKLGITRASVFYHVKNGNIKAEKVGRVYMFEKEELKKYMDNRYIRKDKSLPGELTIKKAAEYLNVPLQRIYYLIRQNSIKCVKRNGMLYIKKDSLK